MFGQDFTWYADVWRSAQGLEGNLVADLVEDQNGNIWVGTDRGLFRHVGHELVPLSEIVVSSELPRSIAIADLYVDSKNRIWIGTDTDSYCYDQAVGEIQRFSATKSKPNALVGNRHYGFHEDGDGHISFSIHGKGLTTYYEEQDSFSFRIPFMDSIALKDARNFQLMLAPVHDRKHQVVSNWFSTLTSLVYYDIQRDTFIYYNTGTEYINSFREAVMNDDGMIWCSSYSNGIWSFDPKTDTWHNYRSEPGPNNFINGLNAKRLLFLNDDELLIGCEFNGPMIFNIKSQTFKKFRNLMPNGYWPNATGALLKDSKGNVWIGGGNGALYQYAKNKQQFNVRYESAVFYDALFDPPSEQLYLLDYYQELFIINKDQKVERIKMPSVESKNDYAIKLEFTQSGELYAGMEYGLLRFDRTQKRFYNVLTKEVQDAFVENGYVRGLIISRNDVVWFGSQNGNVMSYDLQHKAFRVFEYEDGKSGTLVQNYVTAPKFEDTEGRIWFRSEYGVFYHDPTTGQFSNSSVPINTDQDDRILFPSMLVPHDDGRVYGMEGLKFLYSLEMSPLESQTARIEMRFDGLEEYDVRCGTFDRQGHLWIGTSGGILKINLSNDEYVFFGQQDGINDIYSIKMLDDGTLLCTGYLAYYQFDPVKIQKIEHEHSVLLSQFQVFDEPYRDNNDRFIKNKEHAKLTHQQNFFSFTFDDISKLTQSKKSYAYKLEGLNEDWIESGYRNYAAYTNVDAGDYTFKVKSKWQDDSDWSEETELLHLSITPPYWEKPWFIFVASILTLGLIYLVYRYRIQQLREKQDLVIAFNKQLNEVEMKALRAQMNPHFLFNVLNAVKLKIQKNEQDQAIDFITDFSKLIRSVLQNSEKKKISLREDLAALDLYIKIEQKRFNTEFEYQFKVDPNLQTDQIFIPPLLLQPYVENAIWHGLMHKTDGKGKLDISISEKPGGVEIQIEDNGIGREKAKSLRSMSAKHKKSMGMQITQDRMKLSEQAISVEVQDLYDDNHAIGTRVLLTLGN